MTDKLTEEIYALLDAYGTNTDGAVMRIIKTIDRERKAAVDEYEHQEAVRREKENMRGES